MFAKDLVKKILVLDPARRFTIQQILAHPWFKQNGVQLGSAESPKKADTPSPGSREKFSSFLQERIAESIMPGQEIFDSPMPTQQTAKFPNPGENDSKSTAISFTPEELASAIRPHSILKNSEIASKFLKPPRQDQNMISGFKNAAQDVTKQTNLISQIAGSSLNSSFNGSRRASPGRPANEDNGSNSQGKSALVQDGAQKSGDKEKQPKTQMVELQKFLFLLKNKDEEIEKLKLRVAQLEHCEKLAQD